MSSLKLVVAVLAIALAAFALAPVPARADQFSDGYYCWTAGYVRPAAVTTGSIPTQYTFEDEWGNYIAMIAVAQGAYADFLYWHAARDQAVEVVTRAVRTGKGYGCSNFLKSPLYMYPIDDPSSLSDSFGGGKG